MTTCPSRFDAAGGFASRAVKEPAVICHPTTLESIFGLSTMTAWQYNNLWTSWDGFPLRPDNFDELVAER